MDTQEQTGRYRILNRDAIKYIAMFTMLLNHIAQIFMAPGAFWTLVLTDVGYFTAPVMCWFLVEGYGYTRSKKRYGLRLAAFAALSELPFCLAFTHGAVLSYYGMNMIFTLLLCFLILVADEKIRSVPLRRLAKVGLTLLTVILPSDWNLLAPVYTMLFAWARGSRTRAKWAFFWPGPAGLVQSGDQPGRGGGGSPGRRGHPVPVQRPTRRSWPPLCPVVFLLVLPGAPAGAGPAARGADVNKRQKPGKSRARLDNTYHTCYYKGDRTEVR